VRHERVGFPPGWWRGVGPTHNVFVVESFIDELAHAARQDPVAYRRALLGDAPRARAVLDLAAEKAGWGRPMPPGHGRGVAVELAMGSYVAQIAELAVAKDGTVRVERVVCAVDCGQIINPDTVTAQMEGGIMFGIGGALWGEITIKNGRVQQQNFNDYRVLRINEAPVVEVYLTPSHEAPGGIGEPGTACIAPAMANAVFAATGKRLRKLPLKPEWLRA
jgi:isoquinoline 1-oxidoreductase beta subunit